MNTFLCPHKFGRISGQTPHYCTYIQVPKLLGYFPVFLKTPDDFSIFSFFSSSALWIHLINEDLAKINKIIQLELSMVAHRKIVKLLRRCISCASILIDQSDIAACLSATNFSFALRSSTPEISNLNGSLDEVRRLNNLIDEINEAEKVQNSRPAPTNEDISSLSLVLFRKLTEFKSAIDHILEQCSSVDAPVRNLHELVDAEQLIHPAYATLRRHHPQALGEDSNNDELTFIVSHQTFELWFPAALAWIDQAIEMMHQPVSTVLQPEIIIRKIVMIYRIFHKMIQLPQTMTAADYLLFRHQLKSGSGVESIGYRLMEISIGQRDEVLMKNLKNMNLLTDEISNRLAKPSLGDAYLGLLQRAGLADDVMDVSLIAQNIAMISCPTGTEGPYADLVTLGEALIELEQAVDLWRHLHLSMVDRMIGYRRGLEIGGLRSHQFDDNLDADNNDSLDGRGYLLQTLTYERIFPYLWKARSLMRSGE